LRNENIREIERERVQFSQKHRRKDQKGKTQKKRIRNYKVEIKNRKIKHTE
jgi:hypothetical protein